MNRRTLFSGLSMLGIGLMSLVSGDAHAVGKGVGKGVGKKGDDEDALAKWRDAGSSRYVSGENGCGVVSVAPPVLRDICDSGDAHDLHLVLITPRDTVGHADDPLFWAGHVYDCIDLCVVKSFPLGTDAKDALVERDFYESVSECAPDGRYYDIVTASFIHAWQEHQRRRLLIESEIFVSRCVSAPDIASRDIPPAINSSLGDKYVAFENDKVFLRGVNDISGRWVNGKVP
jgi:hypothetical protein